MHINKAKQWLVLGSFLLLGCMGPIFLLFGQAPANTSTAAAARTVLSYFDGQIQVRQGSAGQWLSPRLGQNLSNDVWIRVMPGSVVELSTQGTRTIINIPGEYALSAVFANTQSNPSVTGMVIAQVQSVIGRQRPDIRTGTAAGGTRASEAAQQTPGLGAVSATRLIETGRIRMDEGLYDEALDLFGQAFDFAFAPEEEVESAFLAAYAELSRGNPNGALEWIDYIHPLGPTSSYFIPYGLTAAQAHFELGNHRMALDFLDRVTSQTNLDIIDLQFERFFRGLILLSLQDPQTSRMYLEQAVELDRNSPVGRQAVQVLGVF